MLVSFPDPTWNGVWERDKPKIKSGQRPGNKAQLVNSTLSPGVVPDQLGVNWFGSLHAHSTKEDNDSYKNRYLYMIDSYLTGDENSLD